LAIASSSIETKVCRPKIVPDLDAEGEIFRKPFLELNNMTHPGVKMKN